MMQKKKYSESGYFTVEATLMLPLFMFAFLLIANLATVAKVESITQYAIDQVAKEISQYCYVAERAGLAQETSGDFESIDSSVQAVMDFTSAVSDAKAGAEDEASKAVDNAISGDVEAVLDNLSGIEDNVNSVTAAAGELSEKLGPVLDDPKGVIVTLAPLMAKQAGKAIVGRVIAQPLCKTLSKKYIGKDADACLRRLGVVDGIDGLNFKMSNFLADDRSINVVVVYQIKLNGFGVFDKTLVIKQTASTAAWVKAASLEEVAESQSTWEKPSLDRGKEFTQKIKDENPDKGVKAGAGYDLYDQKKNTFTSVRTIDVYAKSYSDYTDDGGYTLKENAIKNTLLNSAKQLDKSVQKTGDFITMADGTKKQVTADDIKNRNMVLLVVVPEKANADAKTLNKIAKEIEKDTGVKVSITYRD